MASCLLCFPWLVVDRELVREQSEGYGVSAKSQF